MQDRSLTSRLMAEGLGTMLLLAAVVGSGIMGSRLSAGSEGLALLANSLATGAILYVLITIMGPVSGAHFNPAVSGVMALQGELSARDLGRYVLAQITGAVLGVWLAHLMFELPVLQVSVNVRTGPAQWVAEAVATCGLVLTILGCVRHRPQAVASAVGLYIIGAYWFTASTSFANPAVTLARGLTDTFTGIAPQGIVGFVLAQSAGALAALAVARAVFGEDRT